MKDQRRTVFDVEDDDVLAGRGGYADVGAFAAARCDAHRMLHRAFLRDRRLGVGPPPRVPLGMADRARRT